MGEQSSIDMNYGQTSDECLVTKYLDAHLCGGIQQKNLDKILDLLDEYIELIERVEEDDHAYNKQ